MVENEINILLYTQLGNSKNYETWSFFKDTIIDIGIRILCFNLRKFSLSCFSFRVIDGLETLDELEKLPVNEKTYRPLNDVHIKDITIHANPFAQ